MPAIINVAIPGHDEVSGTPSDAPAAVNSNFIPVASETKATTPNIIDTPPPHFSIKVPKDGAC